LIDSQAYNSKNNTEYMEYYEDELNMLKSEIPQQMQNNKEVLQDQYNPFDLGIKKAIEQSRQNLGMNQQQQHRAINNALSSFGNAISNGYS
jgi:ElaB/YqjD/DUF883 family membrane-anchored ribosome-binding protein